MQSVVLVTLSMSLSLTFVGKSAHAGEGGVSFWAPGQFSSLSAVPGKPGLSLPVVYYHASVDAGASKSFIRGGVLTAGIEANADLLFLFPTYTFKETVLAAGLPLG